MFVKTISNSTTAEAGAGNSVEGDAHALQTSFISYEIMMRRETILKTVRNNL